MRLVTEWMDLGGQYFNNPFDASAMAANPLSETAFNSHDPCRSCQQQLRGQLPPGRRRRARRWPPGTSFQGNRFVLTGSAEGDFGVTLSMISDTCNPASNYLLSRPSTAPHPSACRVGAGAAAGGQRRTTTRSAAGSLPAAARRLPTRGRTDDDGTDAADPAVRCDGARHRRSGRRRFGARVLRWRRQQPAGQPRHARHNPTLTGNQRLAFAYFQTLRVPGVPEAQLPIQLCQRHDRDQHLRGVGLPRQHQRHRRRFSCHRQRAADRPRQSGQYSGHHPRQRHVQELLFGAGRGGVRLRR